MATKKPEDRFANMASAKVVQSAANTLTFTELITGISLGTGVGMLIDQIDMIYTKETIALMTSDTDHVEAAWTVSDAPTVLGVNDRRIIDYQQISRHDLGTAGTGILLKQPNIRQFFPPIIVAAPRIYLAMQSAGLASAGTLLSRMYFRYIDLTDKEYLEIAETFILVG